MMNVSRTSGGLEERKRTMEWPKEGKNTSTTESKTEQGDIDWCVSLLLDSLIKPINLYAEEMSNANRPNRLNKMVLSGSYGNNYRWGWENVVIWRGSNAVMIQIRRLHARSSPPFGPAPRPKLFCHSFFSSLSSQSLVPVYATLPNAIAQTTWAAAAAAIWWKSRGHTVKK